VKRTGNYEFKVKVYGSFMTATMDNTTRNDAFKSLEDYMGRGFKIPRNH